MSGATITALAPWYGGKRTLAAVITEEIGKHAAYWEPFCGSMAVLLTKQRCPMETVNDLNGDLVNLTRVLQHDTLGPKLYRHLRRVLASEMELSAARSTLHSAPLGTMPDYDRAKAYFINCWLSMNGTAGTFAGIDTRRGISRRFSSGGGAPAVRFAAAIRSIPNWRERLRRVFVLHADGIELCERIEDKAGTVIYADPPYVAHCESYIHDFTPEDHVRLSESLQRFTKTRVIVSYYDHPLLSELYPGWTKRLLDVTKAMVNHGMRDKSGVTKAPEVLLINGPSYVDRQASMFT